MAARIHRRRIGGAAAMLLLSVPPLSCNRTAFVASQLQTLWSMPSAVHGSEGVSFAAVRRHILRLEGLDGQTPAGAALVLALLVEFVARRRAHGGAQEGWGCVRDSARLGGCGARWRRGWDVASMG